MRVPFCFLLLSCVVITGAGAAVDLVKVDKSKRRMYLIAQGTILKEYRIALGANPKGHKQEEGDKRTPEGHYILEHVMDDSAFYRSMHISYPDASDMFQAQLKGVSPGSNIKVHGLRNDETLKPHYIQSFDWTDGCIAITNEEMDEFLQLVGGGTPITIEW